MQSDLWSLSPPPHIYDKLPIAVWWATTLARLRELHTLMLRGHGARQKRDICEHLVGHADGLEDEYLANPSSANAWRSRLRRLHDVTFANLARLIAHGQSHLERARGIAARTHSRDIAKWVHLSLENGAKVAHAWTAQKETFNVDNDPRLVDGKHGVDFLETPEQRMRHRQEHWTNFWQREANSQATLRSTLVAVRQLACESHDAADPITLQTLRAGIVRSPNTKSAGLGMDFFGVGFWKGCRKQSLANLSRYLTKLKSRSHFHYSALLLWSRLQPSPAVMGRDP